MSVRKARLFSHLFYQPICRDPRVPIDWYHSKQTGVRYEANLPGNENLRALWLKKDLGLIGKGPLVKLEPRAPNAICTNILFYLLSKAEEEGRTLAPLSRTRILKEGVPQGTSYVYTPYCSDALRLWQQLSISWGDLTLPPPIDHIRLVDLYHPYQRYAITLNQQWVELCASSKLPRIKLPLPMQCTVQNIVMHTFGHGSLRDMAINPFFWIVSGNKHALKNTPWMPIESFIVARKWYIKNGGLLDYERPPFTMSQSKHGNIRYKPSRVVHTLVKRPR